MTILSIPPKEESCHTAIIAHLFNVAVIFHGHERHEAFSLPETDLEREQSARREVAGSGLNQSPNQLVADFTAKKRILRVMQNLPRKRSAILRCDVRKIRHDQVVSVVHRQEQVAL